MFNSGGISIYILTIALTALVFGVIINHRQKNGKTVSIWFTSTVLGLLLGASGALGACYLMGYEVVERLELNSSQAASSEAQLTQLVRKLDLLTGDITIHLSDDQAQSVYSLLKEIEKAESLSGGDAKVKYNALLALMEDSQKSKTEAVRLPVHHDGSGSPEENSVADDSGKNPFREGSNAEAIQALLARLAVDQSTGIE